MNQIRKRHFPLPGQRILRSVLAVFLCFIIYFLRGRRGTPFYSIIAALQCIQPYTANMLKVGKKRITGTLVGAFWGGVVLIGSLYLSGDRSTFQDTPAYYMTLVLFAGVVLYSTVLLRITESSYFTTVVFLSIIMNHIGDANPFIFIFNRTMDTIIGVGVAVLANCLHLPRTRDRETLFVSGVDHVLFREDRNLSPFTRIQLNRFIKDGCRFSVSTKQTPATVRELTKGIGLKIPIIAMDGACLYDMEEMTYVKTVKMDEETAAGTAAFLAEKGFPYNINRVEENLLVIIADGANDPPATFGKNELVASAGSLKIGFDFRQFHGISLFAGSEMRRDRFFIDIAHELFLRIGKIRNAFHVIGVTGDPFAVAEFSATEGGLVVARIDTRITPLFNEKGGHKSFTDIGPCCCNEISLIHTPSFTACAIMDAAV
jgi:hypothetical protein